MHVAISLTDTANATASARGTQHLLFQQSSEKVLLHMKHEQMIGNRHEIWTPILASAGNKFLGFTAFFLLAI